MKFSRLLKPASAIVAPLWVGGIVGVDPGPGWGQETSGTPTTTELQWQLEQRDAVISDLLRRVQELEAQAGASGGAFSPAPAEPAQPPEPGEGTVAQDGTPPPAAPGTFEIDEEAVDRALERTLVREGALLLPVGTFEVEPSLTYTRDERDTPTLAAGIFLGEEEFRRNVLDTELMLRFGLPYDSQVEIDVPYSFTEDETVTSIGFAEVDKESDRNSGFGDISIGLTKTLLREDGWRPDLFADVTWDTMTGDEDDGVGTGFHELGATLTAVKRIDPLVWVGGVSYDYAFENDNIRPGDEISLSLGTVLAVSPEASLRFFLLQTFADEVEVFGEDIPGSDQVASTFEFGVSSVLSPRILLDLSTQIGVTDDAPDFQIGVSLPIQFDFPARY